MTTAHDIAAYLGTLTVPITAEVNNINKSVTDTVGIFDTGGFAPVRCHGSQADQHAIDRPSFQVIVRNANKSNASTVLDAINTALDGLMNTSLNGQYYLMIQQTTSAIYLGKVQTEAGETNEYSMNYTTMKQR